jgi:hypothetical protein
VIKYRCCCFGFERRIDASNQERTDMVEYIDGYFLQKIQRCKVKDNNQLRRKSCLGFDRLSILALKIYHMNEEATRAELLRT